MISRRSTSRGRPRFDRRGNSGSTLAHSSSVRSVGYRLVFRSIAAIRPRVAGVHIASLNHVRREMGILFQTDSKGSERQTILDGHISRLLPDEFARGHRLLNDKTITMHFRAGDIFASETTPSWYGQPPLAYYKFILDHSSAEKVVIVYEDTGNPTVQAFASHVRSVGREVVLQSADLRSDLAVLFNSAELVSSMGTFVWAVSTISKRLKIFWFLERMHDQCLFARSDISISGIHDELGDYTRAVLSANWAKTPEQLGLMLDYPTSALKMTRGQVAAARSLSSFNELLEDTTRSLLG